MSNNSKHCKDCVYHGSSTYSPSLVCEYPIPECYKINAGGGFLAGHEAEECVLYKSKVDLASEAALGGQSDE